MPAENSCGPLRPPCSDCRDNEALGPRMVAGCQPRCLWPSGTAVAPGLSQGICHETQWAGRQRATPGSWPDAAGSAVSATTPTTPLRCFPAVSLSPLPDTQQG